MAEGGFVMQNQLKFNLGIHLAASNVAVRYHKPNPIIVERAGGLVSAPHPSANVPVDRPSSVRSSIAEDRMALAVRLAQRDLKKQREGRPMSSRSPSPKSAKPKFSKGGTRMMYTKEARDRAQRLQEKRMSRDPLKVREQGWNSGTSVARTQTPPRDRMSRLNLPATTNSPPTRDTDHYPRSLPADNPLQEIERMQKEMESYLQQIQVIEQKAMSEGPSGVLQPAKTRKKDGYLSDEEDPARRALRQEELATRAARQIYNLRQQVRALQDQVTRGEGRKIKHTKKSQVMLRLAAAHRGAVRAIQGFVNQQLPQQDLRQGLPAGYHELAVLIRQLALLSTHIRTQGDTGSVHQDLVNMLDRVDELNKAWCAEVAQSKEEEQAEERRRKSPPGRQVAPSLQGPRGRQPQQKKVGKENRPKGLLKKQFYKGTRPSQTSQRPRKLTPERQNVLQAGLQALAREHLLQDDRRQVDGGVTWNIPAEDSMVSEPANSSLILPKGLQYKREKAQRSVGLDVPETHFTDPTLSSSLKTKQHAEHELRREPWKPGGSVSKSPARSRSRERSRSYDRSRSRERSRSYDRSKSRERSRSYDRSRSKSPRSAGRNIVIQNMDTELMQELFPQGVDGMGPRGRSASPRSRSHRQRSPSPPRSPGTRSRFTAHKMRSRLDRLQQNAEDVGMVRDRERELAEINMRQMLAERARGEGDLNGELMTDMILNDILHDTASELQSLEDDGDIHAEAVTMHHNPTLENIYQRLEQMELEQIDIRRRWGTLQFEEETSSSLKKSRNIERPSGPVAFEITRKDPSQSHRVQNTREYNKDSDAPIIFTKSAPVPQYRQTTTLVETEENLTSDFPLDIPQRNGKIRLKLPDSAVREIHSNLEKYERHLKKTAHQSHSKFDPWKLVEEISDQVLTECLKEIEKELEDVEENIVHQVCKAEFALPEPSKQKQEVEVDYGYEVSMEPVSTSRHESVRITQDDNGYYRTSLQEAEEPSVMRESGERSILQSSVEKSRENGASFKSKENGTSSKKEVSFDHEISYEREISYEHEAIFDVADLPVLGEEGDTARDLAEEQYEDAEEDDEYDDDDDDYEDVDDDDEISEVSPIENEYSTDAS